MGAEETTPAIRWGSQVVFADGTLTVESHPTLYRADTAVTVFNQRRRGAAAASLVYRPVTFGPWAANAGGTQWGVRHEWPDGHREDEPMASRAAAECQVRLAAGRNGVAARSVVSRTAAYGDWVDYQSRRTRVARFLAALITGSTNPGRRETPQ